MSKLFSSLFGLAVLGLGVPAWALPAGVVYDVTLGGSNAGTMYFVLDSETPEQACRYSVAWTAPRGVLTSQCDLDESLVVGREICGENARGGLTSMVQLVPGQYCDGVDDNGQQISIFILVAGERAEDGSLEGIVQVSAGDWSVVPFNAVPAT